MSRRAFPSVILVTLSVLMCGDIAAAQTPIAAGFRDFSYGTSTRTPTGEKPESKLWFNDGLWWGSLFNQSAQQYHIYRFDRPNQRWIDTGTVLDPRINSKGDVLWDDVNDKLYLASHAYTSNAQATTTTAQWARLYRYSYNTSTKTYSLDQGFPVNVSQGKAEALTIAKDSTGRLWVTYVEGGRVKINHSNTSDLDWGAPANLPVGTTESTVSSDDISSVLAFSGNSIGVFWSNQLTSKEYFVWRRDADGVTTWQPIETVLPDANCSGACADDHINLKTDRWGRVFAAIKTSLSASSQPLDMLAVRQADGSWSSHTVGLVHDHMTRPIVLLDENANLLYYIVTIDENGGAIYFKTSPLDQVAFAPGPGMLLIQSTSDVTINNSTSTKQNVDSTTGLLVAASDENTLFYFHNLMALGPPVVSSFTPTSGPTGTTVHLSGRGFLGTTKVTFNGTAATTVTVISDTQVDAVVPTGATTGTIKVTTAQGQGTSGSSFTVSGGGGGGGTSIKNITFEAGSLTDPTTGADRVTGPVLLTTSVTIKGSYSARVTAANAYLEESFTAANDLYTALYVRINSLPTADVRIVQLSNAGTTVGGIYLRSNGSLRLKSGSTTIGSDSTPLTPGQTYRIGVHQLKGSGSNAVLQAFVVAGDGSLSTPFASTNAGTWTTAADRLRVGTTTGVAVDLVMDNIALDSAVMPPPTP